MDAEFVGPILGRRHQAGEFLEGLAGGGEDGEGGVFILGGGLHDELSEFEDALGVAGGLLLGADLFLFAFDGGGILDFLDAVGEEIDLGVEVADVGREFFAAGEESLVAGEGAGVGRAFPAGAGEGVEDVELGGGVEKGLVVVGAVEVDEAGAEALEEGQGDGGVVDKGLAAAGGLDGAAEDELSAFAGVEAGFGEEGVDFRGVGEVEGGLDGALGFAGTDRGGVGAFAEEQIEGPDEDGFAGAGFAGDDVEPGFERDGGFLDEGEIFHSQERQHGEEDSRTGAGVKSICASGRRR